MKTNQKGTTLIEALVTVVIFAFGMLGIAGLLFRSTSIANGSYQRGVSTQEIYSLADAIRLNPEGARNGNYDSYTSPSAVAPCPACPPSGCAPAQVASHDLCEWSNSLIASLGGGKGVIARGDDVYKITVSWNDPKLGAQSNTMSIRP